LFVQWVQAFQMAPRDIATVVRTLGTAFEQMSMWRGSRLDLLVLASPTPRRFNLKAFESEFSRNAQLRTDLATHLFVQEPAGLLGYYQLSDFALHQLGGRGDLNTDDRTVLEYRAPFSISQRTEVLNLAVVRSLRQEALPSFVEVDARVAALLAGAETQIQTGMLGQPLGASFVPELSARHPNRSAHCWCRRTWRCSRGAPCWRSTTSSGPKSAHPPTSGLPTRWRGST
jgi:hypothetical protein